MITRKKERKKGIDKLNSAKPGQQRDAQQPIPRNDRANQMLPLAVVMP